VNYDCSSLKGINSLFSKLIADQLGFFSNINCYYCFELAVANHVQLLVVAAFTRHNEQADWQIANGLNLHFAGCLLEYCCCGFGNYLHIDDDCCCFDGSRNTTHATNCCCIGALSVHFLFYCILQDFNFEVL
jgi:hypothetical protein